MAQELTTKQKFLRLYSPVLIAWLKFYWRVFKPTTYGVKVILTNNGDILIVRHTYLSGVPTFPGGKLDKGESFAEAAKREILEELGIKLPSVRFVDSFVSRMYHKKDTIHIFTAETPTRDLNISLFEIKDAIWYPKDKLPKLGPVGQEIWLIYNKKK